MNLLRIVLLRLNNIIINSILSQILEEYEYCTK